MRVRILSFLNPYCRLVIKAVRVDSPPCQNSTQSLAELLTKHRLKSNLSRETLAAKLGVSLGTLKNWECCRTKPNRQFWSKIRELDEV
jgi:DNA-binding transcriptional regulator YiaG